MKQYLLQAAYILHRRAYRESSFLLELFTESQGRLTLIAKGVRKPRSPLQGLLQPFVPLLLSWAGKSELMTLSHAEVNGDITSLQGDCLFAGFYLNELLLCLLQKWDAHPALYKIYAETLALLQKEKLEEQTLRSFEKRLLEELGYGFLPQPPNHLNFSPEAYYQFVPEQGFVLSTAGSLNSVKSMLFSGKSLLAIAREDWQEASSLQDAKRLTRFILAPLLGTRPIYSRRLFMQPQERNSHEK